MTKILESTKGSKELICLGRNLIKLMHEKHVDIKELSALSGISVSLLNALKRGDGNPTLGTLISLANFFDVSIHSLISTEVINQEALMIIPIFDIQDANNIEESKAARNIYLKVEHGCQSNLFAVQINNSSLMPFFEKGSVFIVSKSKKYADGDIALVRINDEHNVLRKIFIKNQGLLFQYISLDAEPHYYDHYSIIGIVTKVIHNMEF
ncbi:S24 family peptidase [Candidiatus Paracoxiella cheracis]|uniref:S24 family peptidase n=1 Tax=Candidiatus Paracoxiella cheracis TaxID=3405120 RepID=UPI003BF4D939